MSAAFAPGLVATLDALAASGLGKIVRGLEPCAETGGARCRMALPVPHPNPAGLPASAEFDVLIPADPFGRVTLVAVDEVFKGFAHQAHDGTLCLEPKRNAHSGVKRVIDHVNGAIEWIGDAVHGRLLQRGQPWELPDFRMPCRAAPLFFIENRAALATWRARVGEHGCVDLALHSQARAVVPVAFYREGKVLHRANVSSTFATTSVTSPAEWMLLDSLISERHRAPRTFGELEQLAERSKIDLWQVLHRALKRPSVGGHRYLLVGASIPKLVEGELVEVHWQPIAVSNVLLQTVLRERTARKPLFRRERLRRALHAREIPWAEAKNVSVDRLLSRGALEEPARRKRICVIGCGTLGGDIATMLARGGAHDIALFDPEVLELENVGRHVLPPSAVGKNKALALADQLSGCYPDSAVVGHPVSVPVPPVAVAKGARAALERADVIIDCTAEESVLQWASEEGKRRRILVVHMYINAGATILTVVASGKHASVALVDRRLHRDVVDGKAPFSWDDYDPDAEIETGAGCWSGTFPGRGSDITQLTSAAITMVEKLMVSARSSCGRAIVLRRQVVGDGFIPQPLVELAFTREYR